MAVNQRLLQLEGALQKAHALGNTEHARVFAEEIQRLRQAQGDTPAPSYQQPGVGNYQTETYKQSLVDSPVVPATPEEVEAYNKLESTGVTDLVSQGFRTGLAGAGSALVGGGYGALAEAVRDPSAPGIPDYIAKPIADAMPQYVQDARTGLVDYFQGKSGEASKEAVAASMEEAKKLQQMKEQYGEGFTTDLIVGGSQNLSNILPLAGGLVVGALTKSPTAGVATQQALAALPAAQAYANAYTQYKSQYPNASEEDAQNYAKTQGVLEYTLESGGPAKAASSILGTIAKRAGWEGFTEAGTSGLQQVAQHIQAPKLAPQTVGDAAYDIGLSGALGTIMGAPVSAIGASQATADFNAVKPTGDPSVDAGQKAAAEIGRQAAALDILSKPQAGPVSNINTKATTNLSMTWAPGVDLDTPRGEVSPITGARPTQEIVQGATQTSRNLPMTWARGVDLDTPRGAVSDIRTRATSGFIPAPVEPIKPVQGLGVDALSTGQAKQADLGLAEPTPTMEDMFSGDVKEAPTSNLTETLRAQQESTLSRDLASVESQRKAIQARLTETMTRKERKALTDQATSLIAKENEIKRSLAYFQQEQEATPTQLTDQQKKEAEVEAAYIRKQADEIASKASTENYANSVKEMESLLGDPRVQANPMSLALVSGRLFDLKTKGPTPQPGVVAQPTIQDELVLPAPTVELKPSPAPQVDPQQGTLSLQSPQEIESAKKKEAAAEAADARKTTTQLESAVLSAEKELATARQAVTDYGVNESNLPVEAQSEKYRSLVEKASQAEARLTDARYALGRFVRLQKRGKEAPATTAQDNTPKKKAFTESPTILDVQPTQQPTITDQLVAAKEQGQAQPQTGLVLPMTRAERVAQAKSTVTAPPVVPTTRAATPQTTTAVPPQIEQAASPVAPATKSVTFQTEKGSTYTVFEDGTTERDKAARSTPGHEGDSGKKRRTARTVYVDPTVAASLGKDHRAISWASLDADSVKQSQPRLVVDNDKGTITSISFQQGRYGSTESARDIPFSNTPGVGLVPVEVWGKDESQQFSKMEAYSGIHVGNKIVSVDGQAPTRAQRATAPPVVPTTGQVTPQVTGRVTGQVTPVVAPQPTGDTFVNEETGEVERLIPANDPERIAVENAIDLSIKQGSTRANRNNVALAVDGLVRSGKDAREPMRAILLNSIRRNKSSGGVIGALKTMADAQRKTTHKLYDAPDGIDTVIASLENHPMLKDLKVEIIDSLDNQPENVRKIYEKRGNRVSGVYSGDNHTLYLSGDVTTGTLGGRFSTVVHELVHATTLRALNLSKEGKLKDKGLVKATQEFQTVYDQFLKRTRDFKDFNIPSYEREALQYARTDINEFLTMSLTSPEFRSATKNVKFWKPIMAAIRKVLRIPPTDQELFDNMIEKGLDLIESTRQGSEALQQEWADNNIPTKPVADVTITQEAKEAKSAFQSSVSSATRGIASVALPNQGVGTGISDFPARLAGERLVNDRKMIGLINKGSGELESVPTDDRPALNDKMTKALRGEKQALPEEAAKVVKMVREYLDDLSTQLLVELKAAYAGKPIPEGELAKMKVIAKERGTYLARVYDIDFGKMKGNHLLDAYAAGKPTAIARVKPALDHLTSKVASLPQRIVEAKAEADRRNQDEPLSGKQKWTAKDVWEMVGDKSTIKSYYTDIIGSPAGKSQDTMFSELEEAAKGVDPNKAKDIAMQIVADLVGASEHSKSGRTGTGSYNQGLRARDAAMKSRSDMPPWLKNLWGEVHDFISVSAITAARITDVTASVRLGNQLMEESPQLFSDTRPTGKDWVQVGGSSPNAPGLYGRVAGKWAPPEVAALLNASFNPNGEFELSLENLAKNPLGWAGTAVAKTATKVTGALKSSMIKWNLFSWVGNMGNFGVIPVSNGNINPVYLKEASEGMGYLLGTAYTKAKDLTPKQKPVAALIDEALRQGVVDPVMVRTDDEVRLAERERQAMVDAGPIGSKKQRVSRGWSNFSNTVTEGVNFLETTPKLANFYYWLDVMAKTKKYKDLGLDHKKIGQMLADGTTTRQVRLLIREAAVRTSENNISYNKVPKIVKAVEKGLLGSFVNFYFESMRAPARSALNGLKDLKSGDPALRTAGFRSLLGGTTGMLMVPAIHTAWIKASLDTSTVIVGGLLSAVGDEEDEERRKDLETILRTSLAYSEGNSRSLMDVDENGNVWVTDTGRGDTYDTWHSMIKSNIDAAYMFANGEEEAAIEKVKDTFAGVFSNFLGGSLVGGLASDAATGRSRKLFFEEAFPETADHFEEYFGKGANNYVNLQTPGVAKGIIKWAGTPEDAPTAIKILNLFNAPLNKIDTLRGVGAVAGRLSGDRRDAMKDLVESVASVGRIENDRLTAAVDTYRGAYLETWKELRDQVEAAQAAFRLGGVQPRVYNPRIRQAILDVYSNNQVADSVMSGKFFIPPLSDEAFVRGIEEKKALIKDRDNAEELLLRLKEREKFVRDYYKEIKVE